MRLKRKSNLESVYVGYQLQRRSNDLPLIKIAFATSAWPRKGRPRKSGPRNSEPRNSEPRNTSPLICVIAETYASLSQAASGAEIDRVALGIHTGTRQFCGQHGVFTRRKHPSEAAHLPASFARADQRAARAWYLPHGPRWPMTPSKLWKI